MSLKIALMILGLLLVVAVIWYALARKPEPFEDQDYRDEL